MSQRDRWIVVGIVAVGAAVRFVGLDHQSFDHDEAVTALRVIQPSLPDTLHVVAHGERSPPLYYLLAWGWSNLFGTGEAGLRSLSALIGACTVLAAYWAGRGFGSSRTGLVAAAFFALNPYLVWYSQEARSYALLTLFLTLSVGFLIRCLRAPRPRTFALWALTSALALCSHYFAAFVVVPGALWLLFRSTERRLATLGVLAVLAAGIALIPLALSQEGSGRRNGFTETPLASRGGESLLNFVASEEPTPFAGTTPIDLVQVGAGLGGLLLLALSIGLLGSRGLPTEQSRATLVGALAVLALAVPMLLAVVGLDFFNPRNLIAALVPLLIFVAISLTGSRAGVLGAVGIAGGCVMFAIVLSAVWLSAGMERPDYRAAAAALGSATTPRVIVALRNSDDPVAYYLGADKLDEHRYRSGVRVSEIDALSTSYRVTTPPGFKLVSRQKVAAIFIIWRFRSHRPRLITNGDVRGRRVLSERSTAFLAPG